MTNIRDQVIKDAKKIEKQLDELDKETLTKLAEDQSTAEDYARNSIKENEPENLTEEYVKSLAEEMRSIAKMRLKERFHN